MYSWELYTSAIHLSQLGLIMTAKKQTVALANKLVTVVDPSHANSKNAVLVNYLMGH